jgi:hypothetical protein
MTKHACWIAAVAVACAFSADAAFDARPVSVSFRPQKEGTIDVAGLRLNLPHGRNDSVTGVDLGILGDSTYLYGLQANLLGNRVRDRAGALQVSLYNDVDGRLTGFQIGGWNNARCGEGFQVGLLNLSDEFYGVQIGLVNRALLFRGYQIGIINVIPESRVPFMPIINIGF